LHGRWHGEKFLGPTHVCDDLEIRRKALSAEELGRREGRKRLLAKARSYRFRLPSDPAMALLQVGLQLANSARVYLFRSNRNLDFSAFAIRSVTYSPSSRSNRSMRSSSRFKNNRRWARDMRCK